MNKKLYFPFLLKNADIKYKSPLNAKQASAAESVSKQVLTGYPVQTLILTF